MNAYFVFNDCRNQIISCKKDTELFTKLYYMYKGYDTGEGELFYYLSGFRYFPIELEAAKKLKKIVNENNEMNLSLCWSICRAFKLPYTRIKKVETLIIDYLYRKGKKNLVTYLASNDETLREFAKEAMDRR